MNMATYTVGLSEAKANLNKIANLVNETGRSVTVFKRNRPYITIAPAQEIPNEETLEAIAGFDAVRDDPNAQGYKDVNQFFASLGL